MSAYGDFAAFYDELTGNVDYPAISGFLHEILQKYGIERGIVLDLACGTGQLCEAFAARGYEMIGVDASEDMLSEALMKKVESGSDIIYLCQRMQELDLYGTIDAAFCTLDGLNHLNDIAELRRTLARVSLFLNPGGIFVFDCNTPYKHREVLANNTFVYDCDEVYCVWQNTLLEQNTVRIHLDIFSREEQEDEIYCRSEEEFCETAYPEELLAECLADAGLTLLERYDDYTDSPVRADTQRIVYVVQKRGSDNIAEYK